jgi:hypothetical protein
LTLPVDIPDRNLRLALLKAVRGWHLPPPQALLALQEEFPVLPNEEGQTPRHNRPLVERLLAEEITPAGLASLEQLTWRLPNAVGPTRW